MAWQIVDSEVNTHWRAVYTSLHGACLSSVPSGNRAVNPATAGASGHSGLKWAHVSVMAWKRSGSRRLATFEEVSYYTGGQSRETDSLSRFSGSVEGSAKCLTMGPVDCRKRLQNSVWFSSASFQRDCFHCGGSRAGSGVRTRSKYSFEEGGHQGGPSSRQRIRVLQPVLHYSEEGWGVASDIGSASVESLSHVTEVQDAHYQTGRVSDQVRGLVCHDRSKRCVFPCLHPSSTQEVPEVCFRGRSLPLSGSSVRPCTLTPNFHKVCGCCSGSTATPGHPHTKLYGRLVDSSSISPYGGSTLRCCSRPYERVGVKLNAKKSVLSPLQRTTYMGVVWDSTTMQAKLSPARIESILTAVARLKEGRSITVKQFQRLLGLMAAASNVIPFGLLYMRPLQWWLKTKGVFPEGKSVSHDQGHTAMLSCLWHVEETLVLVKGVASSLSSRNVNDRCVLHRLRCGHEWPPCPRSVERPPSHVAHQLPRDAGCVSSIKTLSPRPNRLPCGGAHRQHSGGLLYQPPERSAFAPLVQAGAPDPCVGPRETPFNQSSSHSWVSQSGSRLPVETGAEARGMETPPRGGVSDLENVWPGSGGLVCDSVDIALSPLVLSDSSSSSRTGRHGADVAEASSVHFSPDCSAPRSSRESAPWWGPSAASSPVLAGPSMVLGPELISLLNGSQWEIPVRRDLLSQAEGLIPAQSCGRCGCGLWGGTTRSFSSILQSRAPSTRKLYALKWKLITSWCRDRQLDPVNCPVGSVLEFLQAQLSAGLTHSTLKEEFG